MGSDDNLMAEFGSTEASPTVHELVYELRSSFFGEEFTNVATKLAARETRMKEQYNESRKKTEEVEKEKNVLFLENRKLNEMLKGKQKEFEAMRKEILALKDQINVLNLEKSRVSNNPALEDELKKKQTEIDSLRKMNTEYKKNEAELSYYKKHLEDRVLKLEQTAKELTNSGGNCSKDLENKQQNKSSAENSIPPVQNNKRTEPKFPEIIQIDDDDDDVDEGDDDDHKCIGTLKRKRVSDNIKKEYDSNKKNHQEPKASNQDSMEKLEPRNLMSSLVTPEFKPDPDVKKVDNSFKSILAKIKTRKGRWESAADMVKEFEKDDELCMSAICALHRPKNINLGFDKSRITQLAELINNQYEYRKLKKPVLELNQSVLDDCRKFSSKYSAQLFGIYQKKDDPFFPPTIS